MALTRYWTNAELLLAAAEAGFTAQQRLLDDWTSLGLLDSVQRRKTGKGQDPGVRSNHQHDLWLTLLAQRQKVDRVSTLTNIPVYLWLHWGDEYVPTRQVRKALGTYAKAYSTASTTKAKAAAREHIRSFGLHKAPVRVRIDLETVLADALFSPRRNLDEFGPRLEAALRALLPNSRTRLAIPSIENLLWMIDLRLRGLAPFRDGSDETTFPDDTMTRARDLYRVTTTEYATARRLTTKQLTAELANNACITLATELARLASPSQFEPSASAPRHTSGTR